MALGGMAPLADAGNALFLSVNCPADTDFLAFEFFGKVGRFWARIVRRQRIAGHTRFLSKQKHKFFLFMFPEL